MPVPSLTNLPNDLSIFSVNFRVQDWLVMTMRDFGYNHSLIVPLARYVFDCLPDFLFTLFSSLRLYVIGAGGEHCDVTCWDISYLSVDLARCSAWEYETGSVEVLTMDEWRHPADDRAAHYGDWHGLRGGFVSSSSLLSYHATMSHRRWTTGVSLGGQGTIVQGGEGPGVGTMTAVCRMVQMIY